MASLENFFQATQYDIGELTKKYGLENFVETGTGYGETLSFCIDRGSFKKIYSIEIHEEIANKARDMFKYFPCEIITGNSSDVLLELCPKLEGNTFFWLDAHFPGADFKYAGYGDEKDDKIRIPLSEELKNIISSKDVSKDVFIMDDLRVYEDGPFTHGNWEHRRDFGGDGIQFVFDLLGDTHDIIKDYNYQGFVICLPKSH